MDDPTVCRCFLKRWIHFCSILIMLGQQGPLGIYIFRRYIGRGSLARAQTALRNPCVAAAVMETDREGPQSSRRLRFQTHVTGLHYSTTYRYHTGSS